jgi:class I fructose-bisphosphate aldolase
MSDYYTAPKLDDLDLPLGKRVRLQRLLYKYGPGNGKMMVLPIDQGMEHGPVDFFGNPDAKSPRYQFDLAKHGGYSAIALGYGLASKYLRDYAGDVPLILKLNGRTNVPSEAEAFSPLTSTVEDAVRLGADAVGYTVYVGSPSQERDFAQFREVRSACDTYGMPLIMWGYPRGSAINGKGGRDSFYAIDYAARVGEELGADVVKINLPKFTENDKDSPKPYDTLGSELGLEGAFRQCVESAGRCLVLVSGGSKVGDDDLLEKVRLSMRAGATGLIFGRNFWQRPMREALAITGKVREVMSQ